ncbi:hypothetical protein ACMD2_22747, partial [Ananas comosus]
MRGERSAIRTDTLRDGVQLHVLVLLPVEDAGQYLLEESPCADCAVHCCCDTIALSSCKNCAHVFRTLWKDKD